MLLKKVAVLLKKIALLVKKVAVLLRKVAVSLKHISAPLRKVAALPRKIAAFLSRDGVLLLGSAAREGTEMRRAKDSAIADAAQAAAVVALLSASGGLRKIEGLRPMPQRISSIFPRCFRRERITEISAPSNRRPSRARSAWMSCRV